jgi:NarL family two-component system response regulator LiaR
MIVDDHPIVREGLEMVLNIQDDLNVVATAANGLEAIACLQALPSDPDVILVDIQMPEMNGTDFIKQISVTSKIIILSTELDVDVAANMLALGVHGYILKDEPPTKIVQFVKKVAKNDDYLAMSDAVIAKVMQSQNKPRPIVTLDAKQVAILQMVAQGMTNKEIAAKIFVTDRTVKAYLTEIYDILQVSNRAQAIAVAAKTGII